MDKLIFDVLSVTAGVIILFAVIKRAVKDLRLRIQGTVYEGEITGSCWSYGGSPGKGHNACFCPVVRIAGQQAPLYSVRALPCRFCKKKEDYYGERLTVICNPRFPGACTYGRTAAMLFKNLLLLAGGGYIMAIGVLGIIHYV